KLRRAYGHRVIQDDQHVDLEVGLIKPGTDADVLRHGRVQEGFDAAGAAVLSFYITAKHHPTRGGSGWLTVPIYNPDVPGTSKNAIDHWVRVRSVTLKPRPALPAMAQAFEPKLAARVAEIFAEVFAA